MQIQITRVAQVVLVVAAAAVLTVGMAREGAARQRKLQMVNTCNCHCDLGPSGTVAVTYDLDVAACAGALNGKTCNVERPDGTIRSGRLEACTDGYRWKTIEGTFQRPNQSATPVPGTGTPANPTGNAKAKPVSPN